MLRIKSEDIIKMLQFLNTDENETVKDLINELKQESLVYEFEKIEIQNKRNKHE